MAWPPSPLYPFHQGEWELPAPSEADQVMTDSMMEALVGHYAQYSVVAYEDTTTKTTMRTFIISYGFTDFYMEDGRLMQADRFVHAEQKLSRKNATSAFSSKAVQAIKPRVQEVELSLRDGTWYLYRPATPTLLGITGDHSQPLTKDPADPRITDPDGDGHPGMTVGIAVGKFFKGEIYIIRREIYENHVIWNPDGTLSGYVTDRSEQLVVGASKKILEQESHSLQHPDAGLNPLLLVPVDPDIDTPEELMEIRDELFPVEPDFFSDNK
jgi:hypothetical protein